MERDSRQANMLWSSGAPSMMRFDEDGMLEAYAPAGVERLESRLVDGHGTPHWVGIGA